MIANDARHHIEEQGRRLCTQKINNFGVQKKRKVGKIHVKETKYANLM